MHQIPQEWFAHISLSSSPNSMILVPFESYGFVAFYGAPGWCTVTTQLPVYRRHVFNDIARMQGLFLATRVYDWSSMRHHRLPWCLWTGIYALYHPQQRGKAPAQLFSIQWHISHYCQTSGIWVMCLLKLVEDSPNWKTLCTFHSPVVNWTPHCFVYILPIAHLVWSSMHAILENSLLSLHIYMYVYLVQILTKAHKIWSRFKLAAEYSMILCELSVFTPPVAQICM